MKYLLLVPGFFLSIFTSAQFSIGGYIGNEEGAPLSGASIRLKGTYLGTTSNSEGRFKLSNLPAGILVFEVSYLGYEKLEYSLTLHESLTGLDFILKPSYYETGEFVVSATRVKKEDPIAHQNISELEIKTRNLSVDMPFVLDLATSVVSTSDAGNGVGYTAMRIRGSDATRVNVTLNGIPYNDPESHGTFWVNLPDIAGSTNSIQIQRGVGTSSNGPSAFGGSVNVNTLDVNREAFGRYEGTLGSFGTARHSLQLGTGLLKKKFVLQGRASVINSEGYIDRASSALQSYYLSANYLGERTRLNFVTFSGAERTYQAWYGVPETFLDTNRTFNPYDYPDQVDDYRQTHYQLHLFHRFSNVLTLNLSGFYVMGKGFFEEYVGTEYNQNTELGTRAFLPDYGITPPVIGDSTIAYSNLVRRRWLDNDYYGGTFSLQYNRNRVKAILGGSYGYYFGNHFGQVIWTEFAGDSRLPHEYYRGTGEKHDYNSYLKLEFIATDAISVFGDVQLRHINYIIDGIHDDGRPLGGTNNAGIPVGIRDNLTFFNPKGGIKFNLTSSDRLYGSVAVGQHEPNRNDYINAHNNELPAAEKMIDYEVGYQRFTRKYRIGLNVFFMDYTDQLVLTGAVNDVGAPIRQNAASSYRLGVEIEWGWNPIKGLDWIGSATLSENKVRSMNWYVDNWLTGEQSVYALSNTNIAFSPGFIGISQLKYSWGVANNKTDEMSVNLITKYVGKQFLDNSQNERSALDAYLTQDIQFMYMIEDWGLSSIAINVMVRNVFNTLYVSNGWVYNFEYPADDFDPTTTSIYVNDIGDGRYQSKALFPQAGINILAGLTLAF